MVLHQPEGSEGGKVGGGEYERHGHKGVDEAKVAAMKSSCFKTVLVVCATGLSDL
jgi:hypothetical protein